MSLIVITLLVCVALLGLGALGTRLKIKVLVDSLNESNQKLNETRTLVSSHEKKLKQIIKSL